MPRSHSAPPPPRPASHTPRTAPVLWGRNRCAPRCRHAARCVSCFPVLPCSGVSCLHFRNWTVFTRSRLVLRLDSHVFGNIFPCLFFPRGPGVRRSKARGSNIPKRPTLLVDPNDPESCLSDPPFVAQDCFSPPKGFIATATHFATCLQFRHFLSLSGACGRFCCILAVSHWRQEISLPSGARGSLCRILAASDAATHQCCASYLLFVGGVRSIVLDCGPLGRRRM